MKLPLAPALTYASGAALDLTSTHYFLQFEGLKEGNPMGAWLSDRPNTLIIAGVAVDATSVLVLHKLIGQNHRKLERMILYTGGAVRAGIALKNIQATKGRRRR